MSPSELAKEINHQMNLRVEQHLRVCIKPQPWWLPVFVWRWLLKRLVVLEMTSPKFTVVK